MKIKELKNLVKNMPDDMEVFVALGSIRVDSIKSVKINEVFSEDGGRLSFTLVPTNYKPVETKGIDY